MHTESNALVLWPGLLWGQDFAFGVAQELLSNSKPRSVGPCLRQGCEEEPSWKGCLELEGHLGHGITASGRPGQPHRACAAGTKEGLELWLSEHTYMLFRGSRASWPPPLRSQSLLMWS